MGKALAITMRATSRFDASAVRKKAAQGRRRALFRGGFAVRKSAQASMKRRRTASKPGQPPAAHLGFLRRLVLVGWDSQREVAVVGPKVRASANPGAAQANEHGGRFVRKIGGRKPMRVVYPARPFMAPALRRELPEILKAWKGVIK